MGGYRDVWLQRDSQERGKLELKELSKTCAVGTEVSVEQDPVVQSVYKRGG